MQYQLKRIQDGSFAKEFMDDQAAGAPKFKKLQEEYSHPHLETVGPKLRAMFSWNNAEAKDKDELSPSTARSLVPRFSDCALKGFKLANRRSRPYGSGGFVLLRAANHSQ